MAFAEGAPIPQDLYTDLPSKTQEFLREWKYKGIYPPEISIPAAHPSIGFMIANLKLPETGPAKIIEFGGVGSRLDGYPEGELAAVTNLYIALASLEIPVHVVTEQGMLDALAGIDSATKYTIGFNKTLASDTYGIQFGYDERKFAAQQAGIVTPLEDVREAKGIVWAHKLPEALSNVDRAKYIVVNEDEVEAIINDKATTTRFFKEIGLEDVRPHAWVISPQTTTEQLSEMLSNAEGIEKFVLKPNGLTNGRGVEVLKRDQVAKRLTHLLSHPEMHKDFDHPDFYLSGILHYGQPLILEEYISSKPIEVNSERFDPTMRIALMTIVNNGKLTVIPICAQWELPKSGLSHGWTTETVVSGRLDESGGIVEVDDVDFQRGFASVVRGVSEIMKTANTTVHTATAPEPERQKEPPYYRRSESRPVNPEVDGVYILFGRKVRFLGHDTQKNGMKIFNVEYLDDPNPDISPDDEGKGEIASHGYWSLERLQSYTEE